MVGLVDCKCKDMMWTPLVNSMVGHTGLLPPLFGALFTTFVVAVSDQEQKMPPMSRPGARVNEAVFKIIQRNECACVCVSRERERERERLPSPRVLEEAKRLPPVYFETDDRAL